jgi:hypothetical protein
MVQRYGECLTYYFVWLRDVGMFKTDSAACKKVCYEYFRKNIAAEPDKHLLNLYDASKDLL